MGESDQSPESQDPSRRQQSEWLREIIRRREEARRDRSDAALQKQTGLTFDAITRREIHQLRDNGLHNAQIQKLLSLRKQIQGPGITISESDSDLDVAMKLIFSEADTLSRHARETGLVHQLSTYSAVARIPRGESVESDNASFDELMNVQNIEFDKDLRVGILQKLGFTVDSNTGTLTQTDPVTHQPEPLVWGILDSRNTQFRYVPVLNSEGNKYNQAYVVRSFHNRDRGKSSTVYERVVFAPNENSLRTALSSTTTS